MCVFYFPCGRINEPTNEWDAHERIPLLLHSALGTTVIDLANNRAEVVLLSFFHHIPPCMHSRWHLSARILTIHEARESMTSRRHVYKYVGSRGMEIARRDRFDASFLFYVILCYFIYIVLSIFLKREEGKRNKQKNKKLPSRAAPSILPSILRPLDPIFPIPPIPPPSCPSPRSFRHTSHGHARRNLYRARRTIKRSNFFFMRGLV